MTNIFSCLHSHYIHGANPKVNFEITIFPPTSLTREKTDYQRFHSRARRSQG